MKKTLLLLFLALFFSQPVFWNKAYSQARSPGEITVWVGASDREIIADVSLSLYSYPERKTLLGSARQMTGVDGRTTFRVKQILKAPQSSPSNAVLDMEVVASPKVKTKASVSLNFDEGAYLVVRISKDNSILMFSKEESVFTPPIATTSPPRQKEKEPLLWLLAFLMVSVGFGAFLLIKRVKKS